MLTKTKTEYTCAKPSFFCKFLSLLSPQKPDDKETAIHIPHVTVGFERVFHYFDEDGDGKISPSELRNCMKSMGKFELSKEEAEEAVESRDSDGDGVLGFEDFVKLVEVEGEEEKLKDLREAFQAYEMEGEDCITVNSLRRAFRRLGEVKSMDECKAMIRRFDLNGDGVISFDEFRDYLSAAQDSKIVL